MSSNARLWIGTTLLGVILINYIIIGIPLISKSSSIQNNARAMVLKQAKSGNFLTNPDDEYLLAVFSREKSSLDSKITLLNAVTITVAFFALSWMAFGLVFKRK